MYHPWESQVLINLKGMIYFNASTNQILTYDNGEKAKSGGINITSMEMFSKVL